MAWARIKFLTPQAKILALAASPLGQEFLPLGSRILFSPSPLGENPIFITKNRNNKSNISLWMQMKTKESQKYVIKYKENA